MFSFKESVQSDPRYYKRVGSFGIAFKAEFERCISVSKNEQLSLFRSLSDGWSLIENDKGQRGFVPTDYLEFSF
jgi:hypothetical protein